MKYPAGQPSFTQLEIDAVQSVMASGWITQGKRVQQFEKLLAEHLDVKHVVVCSSGTSALHLSLASLGIGPGDEVLVPDVSYVATANAVTYVGATPILVDIEPRTWGICLRDASRLVSSRTKAILLTHLYGVPCDLNNILHFATEHGLQIIEDSCEALGAQWGGSACGTWGICGVFSFYGNKIITTGEGGAVCTDNDELADTLRFLRGQAQSPIRRFWHSEVGFNYRMTDLQAALGVAQMLRLPKLLDERRRVIKQYLDQLSGILTTAMTTDSAPWLFTGILPVGTLFQCVETQLATRGIEVRPVFVPMHRLPMYARPNSQFPNANRLSDCGISLPTYPELTTADVDYISSAVREVVSVEVMHG